ncbi:MAG: hypothetical protein ACYC9D_12700 [Candidatus Dormibacteria bacterium]
MRSTRSVLKLEYTPVSVTGGVRKAVGGFLRYLQHRDQEAEPTRDGGLDAYVRYLEHRDRTSPRGRVFGRDEKETPDRKRLVDYISRSTAGLAPNWVRRRDGTLEDRQRAAYSLMISPDDWRGLDLRRLARTAMNQLELDAGGLGPWFAAEHRNTDHHHVQIVLAARRETKPGQFRTVLITRPRLQRMKEAISREIELQRCAELEGDERPGRQVSPAMGRGHSPERLPVQPASPRSPRPRHSTYRWRGIGRPTGNVRKHPAVPSGQIAAATLWRLQSVALRYQHQLERELDRQLVESEREGWQR